MSAVRFDHVSKAYDLQAGRRTVTSALKNSFGGVPADGLFYALSDISFEVPKGQAIGFIGRNGSGKSTILKLIAGITKPTSGTVTVEGRVSSLIELGAGFHPEMTGRENIYMNASVLGIPRKSIDHKFKEIVDFAELWEFIDVPIKKYSSGMAARLGFAVASNLDPEIFIVDEALSVGDMFFQAKCMIRIKAMIKSGVTFLFVSHAVDSVISMCQQAILLEGGKLILHDKAEVAVERYFSMRVRSEQKVIHQPHAAPGLSQDDAMQEESFRQVFTDTKCFDRKASYQRIQNGKARFVNVQLLDENYQQIELTEYEQPVILRMAIVANCDLPVLSYGYHIRDKHGNDIVYSDSDIERTHLRALKSGEKVVVDWHFTTALKHGNFTIACVLSIPIDLSISHVDFCDFVPIAAQFEMLQRPQSYLYGNVHWKNRVDIKKIQ
jgi:lipopolysaccharide transport system ATP-binding protein